LKEEFGLRKGDLEPSSAFPSAAQPRYPPVGNTLPQRLGGEQEARPENYGYGNTGAGGFSQGNASQWEGMNAPNTYGSQNPYVSPPLQPLSSFQNAAGSYGAPTISYSSLPRPGFPGARSAQPGFRGVHAASIQWPASSGYQGQYQSPHSQDQAPGRLTTLSQFNPSLSPGQTMQPVYPSRYPSAGQHVASPTSLYQPGGAHELSWQTEHHNQYGGDNRLTGSLGGQYFSNAQTEQSALPHSTQPYSAQMGGVSPSGVQVNPAQASQALYAKTPSSPAQDKLPIIESESERQTSYGVEPNSGVTVEESGFQVANPQRSQKTKSTLFY
jgi:hypothetical protein